MSQNLRIATRKSPLALWQAEFVKAELLRHHPDLAVELVAMTTRGDKLLDTPLAKIGGKGLFVKEDPLDAFVSNHYTHLDQLPDGATVGTSSLRRQCQVRAAFPARQIKELRGNVNTRLAKLDAGEYQAIILASAGLLRLGMSDRIASRLASTLSLPAGGQGAVGIECRTDDGAVRELLAPLHDPDTASCVLSERALNRHLQGGCQVPIACFAELDDKGKTLGLRGLVGSIDGTTILRSEIEGPRENAEALGIELAEQLLAQGAGEILAEVYNR